VNFYAGQLKFTEIDSAVNLKTGEGVETQVGSSTRRARYRWQAEERAWPLASGDPMRGFAYRRSVIDLRVRRVV
jgi:hypothetical protein